MNELYMYKVLFSVIVPCYNCKNHIQKALASLNEQIFKNFEVILIDDCSNDGTYEYLLDYVDKSGLNLHLYRNTENQGPGYSRNFGISKAQGVYVVFLDSDDWYEGNLLNELSKRIKLENSDLIFFDFYRCFGERKEPINITSKFVKRDKASLIATCYDSLWSLCVKKTVFESVKIPHINNSEDAATIPLLIFHSNCVSFISLPLYNYIYRKNSLSTSRGEEIVCSFIEAFRYLKESLPEYYIPVQFKGIMLILYGAVFKAIEAEMSSISVADIVKQYVDVNQSWYSNPYIKVLPCRKRVFLFFVKHKCFRILSLYVKLQNFIFLSKMRG